MSARWLEADVVVLATGHAPAVAPFDAPDVPAVIRNPWLPGGIDRVTAEDAPGGRPRRMVIAGTGLTMVDVAITVASRLPGCVVHAVSRHGLLPRAHPGNIAPQLSPSRPPPICRATGQLALADLVRQVRQTIAASPEDWHGTMDAIRPFVPAIWRRLSDRDKRVFLEHFARYWEVHRHLMPPATAAQIAALQSTGRLVIHRGQVREARQRVRGLTVLATTSAGPLELNADWLINSTGGTADITAAASPLLRDLFASGLARPDSLRLGIDADLAGAVLTSTGQRTGFLYALGPPLRGKRYETTAIPEIRNQAAGLADQIAHLLVLGRSGSAA